MNKYVCPKCGTDKLLVYEEISYFVNTGEYFCNSVKQHDSDATVRCYDCDWEGMRMELKEEDESV